MSGADLRKSIPPAGQPRPQVAVVTGASAGLGRALSIALARRGILVAGVARRLPRLEETAASCPERSFTPIVGDVSDPERMRAAFDRIERELGEIAILINNAAVHPNDDLLDGGLQTALTAIEVNLQGAIICSHEALRYMVARGRGRIVNVGSFAGEDPLPGSLGYSVSKAGLRAFTKALAAETGGRIPGIVVSEWIPGILATRMGSRDGLDPEIVAQWGATLALDFSSENHGVTFLRDTEIPPSRSLRRRALDLLRGGRRPPRRIAPTLEPMP